MFLFSVTDLNTETILKILTSWYFICFSLSFIILFFFLIYIIRFNKREKLKQYASLGYNNVRLYTIHYNKDLVYSVDKRNMSNPRKENLDWFFSSFTPEDKLRIVVWFTELKKENHTVPHYLEVHVKVKNIKSPIYSIINVTSINYESQIIHIESRLFSNMKKIKKSKKSKDFIKHSNEIQPLISSHSSSPVSVYLIKLFTNSDLDKEDSRIDKMMSTSLASRLVKFLSSTRYLTTLRNNELAIIDFDIANRNDALMFALQLKEEVAKALFLSSLSVNSSFRIGCIHDSKHEHNFTSLCEISREMAIFLEQTRSEQLVNLFDESRSDQLVNEQKEIVKDIQKTMDEQLFQTTYSPIIKIDTLELVGFDAFVQATESKLNNINDMEDYALYNGFLDEFMTSLYKEINSPTRRSSITSNYIMTMNIRPVQYQAVITAHKKSRTPANTDTVFIMKDIDIEKEYSSSNQFTSELKKAKLLIGLEITSTNLSLSSEILSKFDYFFFNLDNFKNVITNKNSILFKDMLSRLAAYKGQIISLNVPSTNMIKVLTSMDINMIGGKLFGLGKNEFPEIDVKKINKILSI